VLLSALSEHARSVEGGGIVMGDIDRPHRMLSVLKVITPTLNPKLGGVMGDIDRPHRMLSVLKVNASKRLKMPNRH